MEGILRRFNVSGRGSFRLRTLKEHSPLKLAGVFLLSFLVAFVAGSVFVQPRGTKAVDGLGLAGSASVSLGASPNVVRLNVDNPTVDGVLVSGIQNVAVRTNVPSGYTLSSAISGTPLTGIDPVSGTIDNPVILSNNTWGIAINGVSEATADNKITNGFDASYSVPMPSATSKWASPGNGTTLKRVNGVAGSNNIDIFYGAKIDASTPAGNYRSMVRHTVVVDMESLPAPTIVSITPNIVSPWDSSTDIAIVGTGFTLNDQSIVSAVTIGTKNCANVTISSNTPEVGKDTIQCRVPSAGVSVADVKVTTWGGETISVSGLTYDYPTPVVTSVSPNFGHFRGGETITITGENFASISTVGLQVGSETQSNCRSFTVVSSTTIKCVTSGVAFALLGGPNLTMTSSTNTASVNVRTTYSKVSAPNDLFEYRYLDESYTMAGSFLDIRGANFAPGSRIFVDGVRCETEKITSSTTATCASPALASTGAKNITVVEPLAPSGVTMQSFAASDCSLLSTGDTVVLTDARGSTHQDYRVRKMPDGRCWMIDNLKLADATLNSTNSDMAMEAGDFVIPANPVQDFDTHSNGVCVNGETPMGGTSAYHTCDGSSSIATVGPGVNTYFIAYADPSSLGACSNKLGVSLDSLTGCGYLYNFYTATAGTGRSSTTTTNAPYSICPKGWKLPTGYSGDQFATLGSAMAVGSNATSNWFSGGLFEGAFAGEYTGKFSETGANGYYWSSTTGLEWILILPASVAYTLRVTPTTISTSNAVLLAGSYAVRCIL